MLEWNKTYQGDNLGYLRRMKDEGMVFNLLLTDPPYNIGKDFGNNTDKQELDDYLDGIDERLALISGLLSRNAGIIWFCTHKYIGQIQMLLSKHFHQRRQMIWYYENGLSRQVKEPVTEYEPFWWYSNSDDFVYNLDDVRVPYKTDRVKNPVYKRDKSGNRRAWLPNPLGRKRGDVWEYPALCGKNFENERTKHKTQKPESLFIDLIKSFCPKDIDGKKYEGRILDPYHGSGTTGVCAERLNREFGHKIEWIGLELEQEWVDVASSRVEIERAKPTQKETDIFA